MQGQMFTNKAYMLQALLTEVARIRLHGFSEREVRQAQATMLSDVESAYIERDQDNSQVTVFLSACLAQQAGTFTAVTCHCAQTMLQPAKTGKAAMLVPQNGCDFTAHAPGLGTCEKVACLTHLVC